MEKNEQLGKVLKGPICRDATLRNASDFLEEARKGNIECCFINYRRKDDGTIRTFIKHDEEANSVDRFLKCLEVAKWELMEGIMASTIPAHPELEEIEDDDGE